MKEDKSNRLRFYDKLVKAFSSIGADEPPYIWNEVKKMVNDKELGKTLDNMSAEEFYDWQNKVIPMLVDKASGWSVKHKNDPYEKKWADAATAISGMNPNGWNREKFLNTLGRSKKSDKELLEMSANVPKGSVLERIMKDPHIGELDDTDYAKLRSAGLYDDEIAFLADRFRKEYQGEIADIAKKETKNENKKADIANVKEFESPNTFEDWLASKGLKFLAPEKWAMMREDVVNRDDRGATEGVTDPSKAYQAAKYLFDLEKDGGWKDELRNLLFGLSGYANKIPGVSKLGAVGDVYAAPVAIGVGDMASDALSDYYEVNPAKSFTASTLAGTLPTLTTYAPKLAQASGNAKLVTAARKAVKRLRRGLDSPAAMEQSALQDKVNDIFGIMAAGKAEGNAFRKADIMSAQNELVDLLNASPKAMLARQGKQYTRGELIDELNSGTMTIEKASGFMTPLSKEEYISLADNIKNRKVKPIIGKKDWDKLSEKQKKVHEKNERDLRQQELDIANADMQLDLQDRLFPLTVKDWKEAPSIGSQGKLEKKFDRLTQAANIVGGTMEPLVETRWNVALPWQGDNNPVNADKVARTHNWTPADSLVITDPLYEEWLKEHK